MVNVKLDQLLNTKGVLLNYVIQKKNVFLYYSYSIYY